MPGVRRALCRWLSRELGQASVELVAVVPFALLVGLLGWQLVLAGHAAWMSANAARVAARAEAVGRDGEKAARSALPKSLERALIVEDGDGGEVTVRVRVPPALPLWKSPVAVSATADLEQPP